MSPNRIDCFATQWWIHIYHKWSAESPASFHRLHVKILTDPTRFSIEQMTDTMREVYATANIRVDVASTERLDLPLLTDLDLGEGCGDITTEVNELFNNRNNVGTNDIVAYFIRSTVPVYNGCAAYPSGKPGCVTTRGASLWTFAHEIGHVLGLPHVDRVGSCLPDRLMTCCGTDTITNPPPDLIDSEIRTMEDSTLTRR